MEELAAHAAGTTTRRAAAGRSGDSAGRAAPGVGRRRILIVEDDHFIGLDIEANLRGEGYEVVGIAATAEEAERLARETRPDIALMDIRLAGARDGVEAALALFREHGIRSLFATAHQDTQTRRRAEDAHPLGWLSKPFDSATLVRAVRAALDEAS